jgi:hypothetical protein
MTLTQSYGKVLLVSDKAVIEGADVHLFNRALFLRLLNYFTLDLFFLIMSLRMPLDFAHVNAIGFAR